MEAVIYTRVSRDKDRNKGDGRSGRSVEDQERECRQACERNGWPVRQVYCDNSIGASRYSRDRPDWKALKDDLRKGDVLVVWEASRAQRDLSEYVLLRDLCADRGVPLAYASGGRVLDLTEGEDRFMGGLDSLIAEREAEILRTRVLRGKRTSATDGRPMTKPPWGYLATRETDAMGRLRPQWELDPAEAPRVREAVDRLLNGETQYAVLEWLRTTDGYAPKTPTTLRRALLNPALAGLRQHQGEVVGKATWEPIITEAQHKRLTARSKRMVERFGFNSPPGPEPKYLLTGIAKCGVCNDGLRYRARDGRKPYYSCHKGHVSRLVDMLDKAVESALFRRLQEVDPSEFTTDDQDDDAIQDEIDELERQLTEWEAEAIAGRVSPGAFGRIEQGLRPQIDALEAKRSGPTDLEFDQALWPDLTMGEQRQIVRSQFDIVVPKLGARTRALPSDVRITPL
jgi:DNA invertase Pin-like site-specific DNA recombinase